MIGVNRWEHKHQKKVCVLKRGVGGEGGETGGGEEDIMISLE